MKSHVTFASFIALIIMSSASAQIAPKPGSNSISLSQAQTDAMTIHLRFQETVSSARARVGQHVSMEVVDDALSGDSLVVRRGTPVDGKVIKAVRRGHNRRNGELVISVERVRLTDDTLRPVSSAQTRQGDSRTLPVFGPCTFPIPADPVGLFRRGKNVVIPRRTEMTAVLLPASHQAGT